MDTLATDAILTTLNLSIGYLGKKEEVLRIADNLNLAVRKGELLCLLGPNGTGKSTLIRTLAGMQKPLAGSISLNHSPLSELSPRERARQVSVVLTDTVGSGLMTVYSLVALGRHPRTNWTGALTRQDRERILWSLEAVDAQHLAPRYLSELSDGERQKVMIARALAQETPLMLLDEPTAFIDLPRRVELMRLLRDLAHRENLSIVLSTHDLDLAIRTADRLWLITDNGEVQEGIPEVLALNRKIASAFASDKLDWDDEQGSFRMHREPCLTVHLHGKGPETMWTQRLLARLGYGIDNELSNPSYTFRIEQENGNPVWTVTSGDESDAFSSFQVFADWLHTQNKRRL